MLINFYEIFRSMMMLPLRRRLSLLVAAFSMVGTVAAHAACYDGPQALPAATISNFINNPAAALAKYPQGGGELISLSRDLVASDTATLEPLLALVKSLNGDQKSAIGSGLAQAARICLPKDQAFANKIAGAVNDTKDTETQLAYAVVSGNREIGSGGAGAGAGSPGGVGGSSSITTGSSASGGPAEGIGGNGVGTPNFTFTSSITAGSNQNGTSTVSNSVSP